MEASASFFVAYYKEEDCFFMTIKELLFEWLYENHKDEIKERTFLRYECTINTHIVPMIGDLNIDEVTPRDLQKWLNDMRQKKSDRTNRPLSASSINTAIIVIKSAYNYANDFELTSNNPTTKLKRTGQKESPIVRAFTRDEQIKIERYIDKLNNNEYFGYILTLYTGLRLGEVMALTWKDINMKTGVMFIDKTQYKTRIESGKWTYKISTPKSQNSIREIPLPIFIRDKLKEIKRVRRSDRVIAHNDGTILDEKVFTYRLYALLKKIKVRRLNFHCLRHTFATRALENKMDIKTLSEILGHSNASTTLNIYAHSLLDHKKAQMRRFKRLI